MSLSPEKQVVLLKAAQELRQFTADKLVAATGYFPRSVREQLQAFVDDEKVVILYANKEREPVYYAPPPASPKEKAQPRVPSTPEGLWMLIRRLKGFTVRELERSIKMDERSIRSFLQPLIKGGYLQTIGRGRNKRMYRLVKGGNRRPLLNRDGQPRKPSSRDRMWIAIKVLKQFDARDLSLSARVSKYSATSYCKVLAAAGYLQGKKTAGEVHYRFTSHRDTGPLAPQLQAGKLIDQNLGRAVWSESEAA